jgi:hypothetical protein
MKLTLALAFRHPYFYTGAGLKKCQIALVSPVMKFKEKEEIYVEN